MTIVLPHERIQNRRFVYAGLVFIALIAFSAAFAWINYANYNWLSPQFERKTNPTVWGIIQRLFLIIPIILIALWRPRQLGFQVGKTIRYRWMLLVMLIINVGAMRGYLILSGATPYSGIDMLFNEVITVPLVEEVVWRGIVFAAILAILRRFMGGGSSELLAGVYTGICFGLLHGTNALYGYPLAFVALQTLNATVWGVVYGIARAKTGSIYPPVVLHAAMNLAIALA